MFNLPFDNLYKFIAACGIVLVCYSAYNAKTTLDIYRIKELDANNRIMYWKQQDNLASQEVEIAIQRAKKRESSKIKLTNKGDKVKSHMINGRTIRDSIEAKIESDGIELDYLENKYIFNLGISILSFVGGILFSFIGFHNWYYKTQKPIDSYPNQSTKKEISNMNEFDDIVK